MQMYTTFIWTLSKNKNNMFTDVMSIVVPIKFSLLKIAFKFWSHVRFCQRCLTPKSVYIVPVRWFRKENNVDRKLHRVIKYWHKYSTEGKVADINFKNEGCFKQSETTNSAVLKYRHYHAMIKSIKIKRSLLVRLCLNLLAALNFPITLTL